MIGTNGERERERERERENESRKSVLTAQLDDNSELWRVRNLSWRWYVLEKSQRL